jgi:hypothetical protein
MRRSKSYNNIFDKFDEFYEFDYDTLIELEQMDELDMKNKIRFYFYDYCCPQLRSFNRSELKSIDHEYRLKYNEVVEEFKALGCKLALKPVRSLSWNRWFGSYFFGTPSWKAPNYSSEIGYF